MLLSLDIGDRYIGVAAGDPPHTPPHRLITIDRKVQNPYEEIQALVARESVDTILAGLPIGLEGNKTKQTYKTEEFLTTLRAILGENITIVTIDETLTSIEAARHIKIEGGNIADEHTEAARIILSEYLEKHQ